jgi:hypothetical protein
MLRTRGHRFLDYYTSATRFEWEPIPLYALSERLYKNTFGKPPVTNLRFKKVVPIWALKIGRDG